MHPPCYNITSKEEELPFDTYENHDDETTHAVVLAGIGKFKNETVILVRNSWGSKWGYNGYVWLYERYLKANLTNGYNGCIFTKEL